MALPVFTIQSFNQNALQAAGAIFVQRVESVSLLRNVIAEVGGILGGRSTTMEKKMNDLTKVLLDEIQTQAKAKYPTAVALIDLHIEFSDIGKTDQNMFLAGQASATALVRKTKKANSPTVPTAPSTVPPTVPPTVPSTVPPTVAMNTVIPTGPVTRMNTAVPTVAMNTVAVNPVTGGKRKSNKLKTRKNR